jgi:hypothetical protein
VRRHCSLSISFPGQPIDIPFAALGNGNGERDSEGKSGCLTSCNLLQPVTRSCGGSIDAAGYPGVSIRHLLMASGGENKLVHFPMIDGSDEGGGNSHKDNYPVDLEDEDTSLD